MSGGEGESLNVPYCFYPDGYSSYKLVNATPNANGISALYEMVTASGYPRDVRLIKVDVVAETESRLRVKVEQCLYASNNLFQFPLN